MREKRRADIAMAAFLTVCLIPSVGMLLLPEAPPAAHQILAQPPRLVLEDGRLNSEVLRETADYVADHLAFRQEMVTADALLDAALFHVSSEEAVVLGEGDWLFYRETIPDHLRTEPMSGRALWGAAHTLALLDRYLASRGADLYVTVAPNKASLYPGHLPDVGEPLEGEDDIDRLVPLLGAEGVRYIDLFGPFREREEELYFHTDSHWTTRGAALAHDAICEALGRPDPFFEGAYHAGDPHRGDLYEMLYPAGTYREPDAAYDRAFTYEHTRRYRSPEDLRIETERPGGSGDLLMFRDSFGNSLFPFLAESFGTAVFSRAMPYDLSMLDGQDTVLIEIVERDLDRWASRAPVFPAPERVLEDGPAGEADPVTVRATDDGAGHVRLEGTLEGPVDVDSPVYVELDGTVYEASPAGDGDGAPFTLYVGAPVTGEGVTVMYRCGGTLLRSAAIMEGADGT